MSNSFRVILIYALSTLWLSSIKGCKPKDDPISGSKTVVAKPDKYKVTNHVDIATGKIAEKAFDSNRNLRGLVFYIDKIEGAAMSGAIYRSGSSQGSSAIAVIVGRADFDAANVKNLKSEKSGHFYSITGNDLVVRFIRNPNTPPGPNNDWYHTEASQNGVTLVQNFRPDTTEFFVDNFRFEADEAATKQGFDNTFREGAVDYQQNAELRNFSGIKSIDGSPALFGYVK